MEIREEHCQSPRAAVSTECRWEQGGCRGMPYSSFLHNISLLTELMKIFSFPPLQMTLQSHQKAWNQVKMSGNLHLPCVMLQGKQRKLQGEPALWGNVLSNG